MILALIVGCSKNRKAISSNAWEVERIKVHANSLFQSPSAAYVLAFNQNGYTLTLDVNRCIGKYRIIRRNIIFYPSACTEACCDSELAAHLLRILEKTRKYKLTDDMLILYTAADEIVEMKKK